jgi:hypothetical protein
MKEANEYNTSSIETDKAMRYFSEFSFNRFLGELSLEIQRLPNRQIRRDNINLKCEKSTLRVITLQCPEIKDMRRYRLNARKATQIRA